MVDVEMVERRVDGALATIAGLREQADAIARIAGVVERCLAGGGTVYTAGNGGSAAQALHLSEELIGRYRDDRPARAAVCLNADATALTCIANDYGFDQVYARQCEALVSPGDVLLVLSTSGRSPNVINAVETAATRGGVTVGLLGKGGGPVAALCDHALVVAGDDTAHLQEAHQVVIHLICEAVEVGVNTPKR